MAVSSNGLGTLAFNECNAGSNPVTATNSRLVRSGRSLFGRTNGHTKANTTALSSIGLGQQPFKLRRRVRFPLALYALVAQLAEAQVSEACK